ncbi:unnamed protein product [Discula destructiva]
MCTELRIKKYCPSCLEINSTISTRKPCFEAQSRNFGVCRTLTGESVDIKWLCGKTQCDKLAEDAWFRICQNRREKV